MLVKILNITTTLVFRLVLVFFGTKFAELGAGGKREREREAGDRRQDDPREQAERSESGSDPSLFDSGH